jgi:hypothetical protein
LNREKPLYRKVNTRTHGVHHNSGPKSRWFRNTKKVKDDDRDKGSMHTGKQRGLDYTPLFKFLLSRVGQDWDETYQIARRRVDKEEPIFWLVARSPEERRAAVRLGESSYYSGLYIDDGNRLAVVAPNLTADDMRPSCGCHTHTFNGLVITRPYDDGDLEGRKAWLALFETGA